MNWEVSETVEQESDKFKRWIKESIYKRGSLSAFSHMDTPQSGVGGGWRLQSDFAFRSLFKAFDTFDDFQVLIKMADSHQNCQHH